MEIVSAKKWYYNAEKMQFKQSIAPMFSKVELWPSDEFADVPLLTCHYFSGVYPLKYNIVLFGSLWFHY